MVLSMIPYRAHHALRSIFACFLVGNPTLSHPFSVSWAKQGFKLTLHFSLFFCGGFCATSSSTGGLLLAMCSGVIPDGAQGTQESNPELLHVKPGLWFLEPFSQLAIFSFKLELGILKDEGRK